MLLTKRYSIFTSLNSIIKSFWNLNQNEFSVSTILCIQLHNSMSSGCTSAKKVKNDTLA